MKDYPLTRESDAGQKRIQEIFTKKYETILRSSDKIFSVIFLFQFLLGLLFAVLLSPRTWEGSVSTIHPHLYLAFFLGGSLAALPVYLIHFNNGHFINRYIITFAQISFSALFIHLTGGRIETHFHVFGSLAFLAFYRDWKVLGLASLLTVVDHLVRGTLSPETTYGVLAASPLRALEHGAWVLFEDCFLFYSIRFSLNEIYETSKFQYHLEQTIANIELQVQERTKELQNSKTLILEQQHLLISTTKMSALGEMAAGVAHEINNPLAVIQLKVEQLEEDVTSGILSESEILSTTQSIKKTTGRIAKIINGLRTFAREGINDPFQTVEIKTLIEETVVFCSERFTRHNVKLICETSVSNNQIQCRSTELSQVILNLLNNSFDAILHLQDPWIKLEIKDKDESFEISVTDSGKGISLELRDKIMQPFFTTKEVGKGTGLGLSISRGIIQAHHGKLFIDETSKNTRFVILIPIKQPIEKGVNSNE